MNIRRLVVLSLVFVLAACGDDSRPSTTGNNGGANNGGANNGGANNGGTNNGGTNNGGANNGGTNNGGTASVTYYQDIKPIIDGRCMDCHYEGGLGPISFETYDNVFDSRRTIAGVVDNGTMPPYLPGSGCNKYKHDPTLTDEQKQLFQTWVDEGAVEGDPADEGEPLESVSAGGLSRVDDVLEMPVEYTPQTSPDDYRCFVLDWPHDTTKYLTGFGVNPGNDEIVHHVIAFLAGPSIVAEAEQNDADEEGPGYTCFGGPGISDIQDAAWLGSWAPGSAGGDYPEGTGLEIPGGSKVILQVHYNTLTQEPQPDKTSIEVKVDDSVDKTAMFMPWANPQWLQGSMSIPAGDEDASHKFSWDPTTFISNGQPIQIWMGFVHMHLLGTSGRTWIDRSDGSDTCLVDIPRWDFDWQNAAVLKDPVTLNPGDQLSLECHWDNTAANQPVVDGEKISPANRNWGEGTTDEMCLGVYYVTMGQ